MQKIRPFILFVFLFCSCKKSDEQEATPLAQVKVVTVQKKTIPITIPAMGHVRAYNSAQIKAQVSGLIKSVHFKEGFAINEGDLLFSIDPATYLEKIQEANATLVGDVAKLKYAADKVSRYQELLKENFVSKLDFEEYLKNRTSLEAQVIRDKSDLNLARINLDYCSIKAPFSGIISKKLIDKGNLIANDGMPMAIINQIDPIYIDFSIPEDRLQRVMQKQSQNQLSLFLQVSNQEKRFEAKLVMIDNSINENTGMIALRAEIKNTDQSLWPGQFTDLELLIESKENALLVPSSSISVNEKGHYIFVIDSENIAQLQFVSIGQIQGSQIEITSGIKEGQKVVVAGQINVTPKSHVQILNE